MTTDLATVTVSALKTFLADNAADVGVASFLRFEGWKANDLRAYAVRVQALREAGFTAAITPRTVAAAEQQVADERAAAEAARVAAEAATAAELMALVEAQVAGAKRPAKRTEGAKRMAGGTLVEKLAAFMGEQPVVVLTVADRIALGLAQSAVTHRAYWAPCNPGGAAAVALNAKVSSRKSSDGFDVVLVRAA
jgi:hypothetical protein